MGHSSGAIVGRLIAQKTGNALAPHIVIEIEKRFHIARALTAFFTVIMRFHGVREWQDSGYPPGSGFEVPMGKARLEAFSDGVLAIIITIMVLELKVPHGADLSALQPVIPVFLSYVLSFVYLAIYWNNHHHMLHVTQKVSGGILWSNLHLLFWLSLVPFATGWMGENHFAPAPTALYGAVLLMAAIAYWILQRTIISSQGRDSLLARAVGNDLKGKISPVLYAIAIPSAFAHQWIAGAIYVLVALMWLIPDRRIERTLILMKTADHDRNTAKRSGADQE